MTLTLTVDTDALASVSDTHLHTLWHAAQANPAPFGDLEAGELVQAISMEIVRRWLAAAPVELHQHQPTQHYRQTLRLHGSWRGPGGAWLPHQAATSATSALTTSNTEGV